MKERWIEQRLTPLNPLEYGLPYSLWDEFILSVYIKQTYQMDISPLTLQKVLRMARLQYADDFFDWKHTSLDYIADVVKEYKEDEDKALALIGLIFLGKTDANKRLAHPRHITHPESKILSFTVDKNAAIEQYIRYYGFVLKLYIKGESELYHDTTQTKEKCLMSGDIYNLLKDCTENILQGNLNNLAVLRDSKQNRLAIQQLYAESLISTASSKVSFLLIPKEDYDYSDINEVQFIKDITDGIDYKELKKHNRKDDDPGNKLHFSGLQKRTVDKRFKELIIRRAT